MELTWFVLSALGLTQILVYGSIFDNWRPAKESYRGWGLLFHCPMCMGFWVGTFLFLINGFTELFNFEYTIANFFICGWTSSATSYVLTMLFDDFGLKLNIGEKNE